MQFKRSYIIKTLTIGTLTSLLLTAMCSGKPPALIVQDGGSFFHGFTSLEERIVNSDVIVRAQLVSVEADGQYGAGNWLPAIEYRFEALDYLKGHGAGHISVTKSFDGISNSLYYSRDGYSSKAGAKREARKIIVDRDDTWDDRQAVLFLKCDNDVWNAKCDREAKEYGKSYKFTLGYRAGYNIKSSSNRVWLPAIDSENQKQFLLRAPPLNEKDTITLEQLRNIIDEFELSIRHAEEQGIEGYERCLYARYRHERLNVAAMAAGGSLTISSFESHDVLQMERKIQLSGLTKEETKIDTVLQYSGRSQPNRHLRDKIWLTGKDAHLFKLITDPTDIETIHEPEEAIKLNIVANEVLPIGSYRFQLQRQEADFIPCEYHSRIPAINYFIDVLPLGAQDTQGRSMESKHD